MSRIKNWQYHGKQPFCDEWWENRKAKLAISIVAIPQMNGSIRYNIKLEGGKYGRKIITSVGNYAKAREIAIKWMKKHPEG